MKYFILALGYVLAKTPESLLRGVCCFVARFMDFFMASRMRVAFSNLSHCFPEMDGAQIKDTGRESARRMVEMALFVLASPHIPLDALKKRIKIDEKMLGQLFELLDNPQPAVILVPHFCMMESITLMPALVGKPLPKIGVFYRPFDNAAIEAWVKESRERCGIHLLSRRKGTRVAVDFLKENGCIALLFDQNANQNGSHGMFFDRVCSTTELPRILAEHTHCKVAVLYAKRTGFWRSEISGQWLASGEGVDISFEANSWLADKMRGDCELRRDWLWLHYRWGKVFGFGMPKFKSGEFEKCLRQSGGEFKRVNRILITPPASLRGTLSLIPILRAVRKSALDAKVSLVCEHRFFDVVSAFDFVDEVLCAPDCKEPLARLGFFRKLRERYFDFHAVIEDSFMADLECAVVSPIRSAALQSTSRKRCFVKNVYCADYASEADSLISYYEKFFRAFGLVGELDMTPPKTAKPSMLAKIAVICGGRGNHAMSAQKWGSIIKALDKKLDDVKFVVFGDAQDSRTAFEITRTAEYAEIKSLAGELTDAEMMSAIGECRLAIGTDCRLTHIANALGVPVVAVYGQTNPVRNGLVFDAPKVVVRPRNSPPQGGVSVELVEDSDVVRAALDLINK